MLAATTTLAAGVALASAGATIAGIGSDGTNSRVHTLALMAFIAGSLLASVSAVIRATERVNRPADTAFDEGYEMGYDAGERAGRRAPALVPLRSNEGRVSLKA